MNDDESCVRAEPEAKMGLRRVIIRNMPELFYDAHVDAWTIPNTGWMQGAVAKALLQKNGTLMGAEVEFLRNTAGISQCDAARMLGCTTETYQRWELGQRQVGRQGELQFRLSVADRAGIEIDLTIAELTRRCRGISAMKPIILDGSLAPHIQPT